MRLGGGLAQEVLASMTQPSPAQPESPAGESAPAVPATLQQQQQQAQQPAQPLPLPLQVQQNVSKPHLTLPPQGKPGEASGRRWFKG